jgi:hypothetical protein
MRARMDRCDPNVAEAMARPKAVPRPKRSSARMAGSAGLFQLTVGVKPARKARTGRAPATGELIRIVAQPASVDVRARPLARAKAALPAVHKARRRLAA